ncbi:MAG: Xaa-Pro peptidase family protein [Methanothrix sp.]|nr:Xaa-Pro peptidase family protein [Methanothrix sp.]
MHSSIQIFLCEHNLDGFLFVGDSICDADMYYLSHFLAGDRFALLAREKTTMLVSSMEKGRAVLESIADECLSTSQYQIMEKLKICGKPEEAYLQVLEEFLRDYGIKRVGVPFRFPAGIYQPLSEDFEVSVMDSPAGRCREIKRQEELDAIACTQRACERAMRRAVLLISRSTPRGEMLYRDGQPLTSEEVRGAIEVSLLEDGCEATDTIVAGGLAGADPHARGTGPIAANAPIVIDIFPRSKSSRYFADMTRTVLRGEASPEVKEIYEAVRLAQDRGLQAIRAGVSGREVHSQVSQVFLDQGYPEREGRGFTHSTGHGVGLDIHEKPSLSETGEVLQSSHVVTVEPGLYYPEIGGVRLEDLVVVKENGCENLTHFERQLVL